MTKQEQIKDAGDELQPWTLGDETTVENPRKEVNVMALDSHEHEVLPDGARVRIVAFQIGNYTDVEVNENKRHFRMISNFYLRR